jgi:hypothetical protein
MRSAVDCYAAICERLKKVVGEPWLSIGVTAYLESPTCLDTGILYTRPTNRFEVMGDLHDKAGIVSDLIFELAHLESTSEKGLFKKFELMLFPNNTYKVEFWYDGVIRTGVDGYPYLDTSGKEV